MIPQHLSESNEHYTPEEVVAAARRVMSGIDLDPASCSRANNVVRAGTFYSKADNGFERDWFGKVFLNPPGGSLRVKKDDDEELANYKRLYRAKYETASHAVAWWRKLQEEGHAGRVTEAIFIGFTIEILCTSQGSVKWPSVANFPICLFRDRIAFIDSDGEVGGNPAHSNLVAYCGPNVDRFKAEFAKFGEIKL